MSKFDADNIKPKFVSYIDALPVYKLGKQFLDCIYHDKEILDACDLFGSADCNKCTNYVKK